MLNGHCSQFILAPEIYLYPMHVLIERMSFCKVGAWERHCPRSGDLGIGMDGDGDKSHKAVFLAQ